MKKILIAGPFGPKEEAAFSQLSSEVECQFVNSSEINDSMLKSANALIGNVSPALLVDQPHLEWVQLTSSGADGYVNEKGIPENILFTTSTGSYGLGIAEYMVAMLLSMMKKIPAYLEDQKKGIWADEGIVTSPFGKRVLIIGTGDLGLEFAKRMRALGCTLVGIRRREGTCPAELDEIYTMDHLKEQLAMADVVAVCLPGTKETFHLFDEEMLLSCKEGSYFMNVGRGNIVPLDAFCNEKVSEHFAGIWLDVCEIEPLPDKHPLYYVPNMLITPHITGGYHLDLTVEKIFQIALHNMKAWLGEGDYIHVLDRNSGYCK
ncbi:MAG: D-2-hydroxyacid dehydrogenase [Eubacteriales bacterium]|nr:D-2-hydroxyacid dehydrogenase [Eubacteriales bacterium]